MLLRSTFLLGILALASLSVNAQYGPNGPKIYPAAMGSDYNPLAWRGDDAKFALDTLHSSYCVAQISKTVAAKTSDKAVQNLAFTHAYDQEKIFKKIQGMAKTLNVRLPSKNELEDCPGAARLRELTGEELNRDYVAFISKNSARDAKRFEAETQMRRGPGNWSLWSFAEKTLPVVREDASSVKSLEKSFPPAK